MMSVDSNFNFLCRRPHWAGPPPLIHLRPPEPDPLPLRVDVINGWPLRDKIQRCNTMELYVCMYVGMHVWMYAASMYACIVFVSSLSMSISEAHVCMTFFICMFACMYVCVYILCMYIFVY